MKLTETETTQQNHNNTYNVVHPQCRGYVHKLRFIPLSSKPQFICALSCRFLQLLTAAHTAAGFCTHSCRSFFLPYKNPLRTQLQSSSTHTAGTCPFLTKPILLALSFLTSKILTYPFYISAYLYCAVSQNPGLKPWAPTNPKP